MRRDGRHAHVKAQAHVNAQARVQAETEHTRTTRVHTNEQTRQPCCFHNATGKRRCELPHELRVQTLLLSDYF